ncbi:MAG TPA: SDR family oxidoreductase [Mycobacterium sp.]|nr:SDR family oxidoreductase [Mycobacterium sp.]
MTQRILVAGGTGTVGRVVVDQLLDAGVQVRVLSRGHRPQGSTGQVQQVIGDVKTGAGLTEAISGVDTVVACLDPVDRLVEAAVAAGKPHLVYISIVGIDRVPFSYYQRKLADEQLISDSGLRWTVLRATQFHDLVAAALRVLSAPPVMVVPAGWSFQPIDVRDVGVRLADLAQGEPGERVPDIGGPQVLPITELARQYLAAMGKRRPIVSMPVPGRVARAYRSGGHLAPDRAVGTIPFEHYLDELSEAGQQPYGDMIGGNIRQLRRKLTPRRWRS